MIFYIDPMVVTSFLRFRKRRLISDISYENISARRYQGKRFAGLITKDKAIKAGKPIQKCPHVRGTHQRFSEGREWIDTEYKSLYESWYKKIHDGKYALNTFEDFRNHRLNEWDKIYIDIKTNGFKEQAHIGENIEVAINSSGQFLLIDGRHRLSFAQILGLAQIPVVVNIISENFARSFMRNASLFEEQLATDQLDARLHATCSRSI